MSLVGRYPPDDDEVSMAATSLNRTHFGLWAACLERLQPMKERQYFRSKIYSTFSGYGHSAVCLNCRISTFVATTL